MQKETRALALLARIIGRRHGIKVVFDKNANTASTDGKTITLPLVSSLGTEDHAVLVEGLIDHEAMHCRFTDFCVDLGQYEPIVVSLTNLIEDVWGEREQAKIYPGCARNIRLSMDVMIRLGWYVGPTLGEVEHPAIMFSNYLTNGLLARLYECDHLQSFADAYHSMLVPILSEDLVSRLWDTACKVDAVMSTHQALALAQEIISLLKQEVGVDSNDQSGQPSNSFSEQNIRQILFADKNEVGMGDMGERLLAALNSQGKAGSNAGDIRHALLEVGNSSEDFDGVFPVIQAQPMVRLYSKHRQYHDAAISLARPIEITLGTRLESILETKIDSFMFHKRSGGRLDRKRIAGISFGRRDVFFCIEEGQGLDTAVSVLVDSSSSMFSDFYGKTRGVDFDKAKISSAVAVSCAAAQVLNRHCVPFEIACYGSYYMPIKRFDSRWSAARRLGMTKPLDGTATDCAIMKVAESLAVCDEERKLVVVITDGESDSNSRTLTVMNEVRKLGIEFSLLFIGNDGHLFERLLHDDGYTVSRALTKESLASSFFDAVQKAF